MSREYWVICLGEILSDHGIEATSEQIEAIASDVDSCSSKQGQHSHTPEHPAVRESAELTRKLKLEQSKVFCVTCQGTGRLIESISSSHSSNSSCWKCGGNGSIRGAA